MEKTERITIKLDAETKERFNRILDKNGQTASKILRLKIQQYILMHEKEENFFMLTAEPEA